MAYLLHHLLMETAQRRPESQAVALGGDSLSYGALDDLSSRLAHTLLDAGCARGDRVAIYMPRSVQSVVAIHGILKAGCAYVPLDERAPRRRLAYILRDCGVKCVISDDRKLDELGRMFAEDNPLKTVVVTGAGGDEARVGGAAIIPWSEVEERDPNPALPAVGIETDLAYILYTSGSTGSPKGVMISHLNSLTFVRWAVETLAVRAEDRVSGHAPLHFDLSIFDIFASFMVGAVLLPVPDGISMFPIALADWIAEQQISVWYSVPSVLSNMVRQGKLERHDFPRLRMVLFAGEVFPVKYLRAWLDKVPDARFFNLYGPTETNVITYHEVTQLAPEETRPVPIGRACANMEVFALTDDGRRVERPGEEGELFARGSCVAQGYWGDAEKTRGVFLANADWPHLTDQVYKTGDLVTLDEDGNWIYLGRRDHMIKKHGYRVELGEIEAALYNHPRVQEAAVVARPDESAGSRIEAFVALAGGTGASAIELKRFVAESLPKYMVPDNIELRPGLPKTSTGKVDRRALLADEGLAR